MKRFISILLCIIMTISLCACSKKDEASERPKLEISGVTQTVPKVEENTVPAETTSSNSSYEYEEPEQEVTEQEVTEPVSSFTPVVLYDDQYCTITQTEAFQFNEGRYAYSYMLEITNKSDNNINYAIGEHYFANDVKYLKTSINQCVMNQSNEAIVPGETRSIICEKKAQYPEGNVLTGTTLEVSIRLSCDNGEVGAFNENFEILNDIFCINRPSGAASEKYVQTGTEKEVISTSDYEIVVIDYYRQDDLYIFELYMENNTTDFLTFAFDDSVTVSSDQQNNPYYLASGGMYYIEDLEQDNVVLWPNTGAYFTGSVQVRKVDGYANSASEVLTVSIPFSVRAGYDNKDSFHPAEESDTVDRYTLTITRDQFLGK